MSTIYLDPSFDSRKPTKITIELDCSASAVELSEKIRKISDVLGIPAEDVTINASGLGGVVADYLRIKFGAVKEHQPSLDKKK